MKSLLTDPLGKSSGDVETRAKRVCFICYISHSMYFYGGWSYYCIFYNFSGKIIASKLFIAFEPYIKDFEYFFGKPK